MAYGVEKGRKLQLGRESTPGTAVAATVMHRGPVAGLKDDSPYTIPPENVGYYMNADRGYFPYVGATVEIPEHVATFEQIMHPFEGGLQTVSPSANGGTTTAYIYSYPVLSTPGAFVLAGSNSQPVKTYTIESGDNAQAYEMAFAYCETIELTFAPREAVKIAHTWRGRQKNTSTFTSLSLATVEDIVFTKASLYVDDTGGTIGSTLKNGTWLGGSISIETGWVIIPTADGQLYFTGIKNTGPKMTGNLTYEYDTTGIAAEAKFAAGTTQLIRMNFPGSALSGSGGTYSTKLFRADFAAKLTSVEPIASQDGNDTVTVAFEAVQGNAGQATPTFTVVNLLSAVP